jgi:hypothetical protein
MAVPSPSRGKRKPWGLTAGLLLACLVVLIGFVRGIAPDVILWRAFVAAVLLGVLASVMSAMLHRT